MGKKKIRLTELSIYRLNWMVKESNVLQLPSIVKNLALLHHQEVTFIEIMLNRIE